MSKGTASPASDGGATPAACTTGSCPCKPIASISLLSLTFKSDHGLLKDYNTDWKDGGAVFVEPEWKPATQHPISHSLDEQVSVELELEVAPPDACSETGTLRGDGPDSLVFEQTGVSFKPGKMKVALTSGQKLSKKIRKLAFKIDWSTQGASAALAGQTSNTAYVTIDKPRDPGQAVHGVTLKRMDKAIELVEPMGSTNPQTIVHELMKKLPYYVLHADPAVPSKFSHPTYFNSEGGAWPMADYMSKYGECQAIVRFVRKMIKQIGAPGDGKMVYIFAKPATPTLAEEHDESADPAALHGFPGFSLVDKPVTAADVGKRFPPSHTKLPGGSTSMGFNAFEACLKFTSKDGPEGKTGPTKTYYYPGGTGGSRHDDKNDVLKKSFYAMVEFVGAWYPTDTDPHKVPGYKITKILTTY